MSARGYSSHDLVAAELAVTLTSDQQTACDDLISAAEDFIDKATGRSWIVASPATEVVTVPDNGVVYLANRPVSAITSVTVRSATIGDTNRLLVAGTDYELLNPTTGFLLIAVGAGQIATIAYTHTNAAGALPKDVQRAATLLTAFWLSPRLHPEREGLDSLSFSGGEIALKTTRREIPSEVMDILNRRERLVFA